MIDLGAEPGEEKLDKFRFGIGVDGQALSSVWVAWAQGSEYYVGITSQTNQCKVSLHSSGITRFAFTQEFSSRIQEQLAGEDRALVKLYRLPTPATGAQCALTIRFPTGLLQPVRAIPEQSRKKPIFWIAPPQPGLAVDIGFFFSREPWETLRAKLERIGTPICHSALPNGDTVTVVLRSSRYTEPRPRLDRSKTKSLRQNGDDAGPSPDKLGAISVDIEGGAMVIVNATAVDLSADATEQSQATP